MFDKETPIFEKPEMHTFHIASNARNQLPGDDEPKRWHEWNMGHARLSSRFFETVIKTTIKPRWWFHVFSKKNCPPDEEKSGLRQMIWRVSKFRTGFVSDRWVFCGISNPSTGFQKHLKRPCYKASYQNPALKGGCWPPFSFAKLRIWLSANDDMLREYPLNALCQ